MEQQYTMLEPTSKRPRSPAGDHIPPTASKIPKTVSNHLQINYLARQYQQNLPLVSTDDNMPAILRLIGEYDGVLHRHESIAGNLGACPLGPILIKRFERLFDGPPRVLKSHGKDAPTVTWLDVVQFAKNKPEQFNLEKTRNGVRVCQFYTKQCRVEISEEDYVLIASGMPQKMIPPQPIVEDEEKELGALEILEKNLQQIIQMADQVSARARQLNHRLKNRRTAIISRRENDASLHPHQPQPRSPTWREANDPGHVSMRANGYSSSSHSPPAGFVAVNAHQSSGPEAPEESSLPSQFLLPHPNADNITIINGTSVKGASPMTRAELMRKFFTTADRQARGLERTSPPNSRHPSHPSLSRVSDAGDNSTISGVSATVPIPSTPSSLLPPPRSTYQDRDDGPYRMEMVARMEELQRGDRVLPPCDRCRRLQMDCIKNLTACTGCTKKHAKCSWRDVKEEELGDRRTRRVSRDHAEPPKENGTPAPTPVHPPASEHERATQEANSSERNKTVRGESAPGAIHPADGPTSQAPSPRRAMSESQASAVSEYESRIDVANRYHQSIADDDMGASQRLMQAIMDTVDHHTRVVAAAAAKERDNEAMGNDRDREPKMLKT